MMYGTRKNGGEHGTVYTRPEVVDFMLDLAGLRNADDFLGEKTLDPAVGEGAFALGLVKRIISTMGDDPSGIARALGNITVVELDPKKVDVFVDALRAVLRNASPRLEEYSHRVSTICGDYLERETGRFDVVIGNPPYVRYDNIPANMAGAYRARFSCFKARSDLYIAFIEKAIESLKEKGILVYICADRWLTNGYGSTLRKLIARNFRLRDLVKIKGFSPFAEEVIAYPSIIAIKNDAPGPTRYFIAEGPGELRSRALSRYADKAWLDEDGELRFRPETPGFVSIEEQGFKIGIGVATGADDVFIIHKSECAIEEEVLVPLITRDDVEGDRVVWTDRYVINPFKGDSPCLVDLAGLPGLARYLNAHRAALERRYVARRDERKWYRTIDRIYPSLTREPKLLIPDISSRNAIVLDEGRFYPHHNFYFITGNGTMNLAVLRALLSTGFARTQVAEKGVLMNGGSLRWQAQTLRKLRLPDTRRMPEAKKRKLIEAYDERDFERIERTARLDTE